MARTELFSLLSRVRRIAAACDRAGLPSAEGVARANEADERRRESRRRFLATGAIGAAALALPGRVWAQDAGPSVGIVGAGLAGLACAYKMKSKGLVATMYEAGDRAGGRQWSLRGFFPGQVCERGGELIDNLHKTMLGYAQEFDLAREDVTRPPGEVAYYFDGQHYPESVVVDQYRDFVPAMQDDLRQSSGAPTADAHNAYDVTLDQTDLAAYLDSRGAGPVIKKTILAAYAAEYGLAPSQQSSLNYLLFIHADKRSKFRPWGVFSDERWHVVDGNDRIAEGLRDRLPNQIRYGHKLVRVRAIAGGRYELSLKVGNQTVTAVHDAVVLAIPFTVLKQVELDDNLGLPAWKRQAIALLGYGTNAKMMVGFTSRPWIAQGRNGGSYSNLANHQCTWETNPAAANAQRGILTDYSSAERGANLNKNAPQQECAKFLNDCDLVLPGVKAAARKDAQGKTVVHLEHWPSNPLSLGSYTCYTPGQFTSIAGNEGKAVGRLHFAGEHTDSFYSWQGFMEGAALSGLRAAAEVFDEFDIH